jgi:hypothetical protein
MDVYYEDLNEHFAAHFRLGFLQSSQLENAAFYYSNEGCTV